MSESQFAYLFSGRVYSGLVPVSGNEESFHKPLKALRDNDDNGGSWLIPHTAGKAGFQRHIHHSHDHAALSMGCTPHGQDLTKAEDLQMPLNSTRLERLLIFAADKEGRIPVPKGGKGGLQNIRKALAQLKKRAWCEKMKVRMPIALHMY